MILLKSSKSNKYVKEIDDDVAGDLANCAITDWSSARAEALPFPEHTLSQKAPAINEPRKSAKWHAEKEEVEKLQAGMLAFRNKYGLDVAEPA